MVRTGLRFGVGMKSFITVVGQRGQWNHLDHTEMNNAHKHTHLSNAVLSSILKAQYRIWDLQWLQKVFGHLRHIKMLCNKHTTFILNVAKQNIFKTRKMKSLRSCVFLKTDVRIDVSKKKCYFIIKMSILE